MIRKAVIADMPELLNIALEESKKYPYLSPNKESIARLITECISAGSNFGFVSVLNGRIVGALFALSHKNIWAQKMSSTVMAWVCRESIDGVKLLLEYLKWVDDRPAIRRAGFQFDLEVDSRVIRVIDRLGFKKHGGCYLKIK